ncbi:hypothetical protein ACNF49_26535 [Actinomadura sp. ATCC 39365]
MPLSHAGGDLGLPGVPGGEGVELGTLVRQHPVGLQAGHGRQQLLPAAGE